LPEDKGLFRRAAVRIRGVRFLTAMLGVLAATTATAGVTCPIERAHYTYSAGIGSADFAVHDTLDGYVSKVSLHINLDRRRDLWFLFDEGSARYVSLISVTNPSTPGWVPPEPDGGDRPMPAQKFFAWSDDLKVWEHPPAPGMAAPRFILIPDLPETLQYGVRDRLVIGSGVFKLDHCKNVDDGTREGSMTK
jgi:hypothetical protein